jgi:hypothetical protein
LPPIVELLLVGQHPYFVVLAYPAWVRLVATEAAPVPPDVVAVLDAGDEHGFVILRFTAFREYIGEFTIDGAIDEARYLRKYADVAQAVEQGMLQTATEHFIRQGYFERREAQVGQGDADRDR